MDPIITGAMVKRLRAEKGLTQQALAEKLSVSPKAVSRWETAKGCPDAALLEPLAAALGVSLAELLSGNDTRNTNPAANMLKCKWYVCPVCGNVLFSTGEASVCCHGILLKALAEKEPDEAHGLSVELSEDEYYVTVNHDMTKEHFISFIAALSDDGIRMKKLYPQSDAEARFSRSRVRAMVCYCTRDGLFRVRIAPPRR